MPMKFQFDKTFASKIYNLLHLSIFTLASPFCRPLQQMQIR